MKAGINALFIALFLITLSPMLGSGDDRVMKNDISDISKIFDKYEKACKEKDMGLLSSLFAHDDDIVVIPAFIDSWMIGWKNVKTVYENIFTEEADFIVSHEDVIIRVHPTGKIAWVSCYQTWISEFRDSPVEYIYTRLTCGLEKQNGKWCIVQAHWSVPGRILVND
jgi:ketosteroid isomerase-like protein